ncbi:preprotein translocase subunit SecD [Desulfitispora alkaliphila]|uniref:protein translocase subunit SecD n=1 Tax=Desulfitispora alkaliphila TaxID=622674 RepID=UPI003D23A571
MKSQKLILFVLIVALALVAVNFSIDPIQNNINLGLDLQGGLHVVMEAVDTPENPVTPEDMVNLQAVMRARVDQLGITEPLIQQQGDRRLIIELPGVQSPEEAARLLGKTAQLEFRTYDGERVLGGEDLSDAVARLRPNTQVPVVILTLDGEGTRKFAEATSYVVENYSIGDSKRRIGIYLDGEQVQNPEVQTAITDGRAEITGYEDIFEAENIAALLRSGALPVKVEMLEQRSVGPTLGMDSLQRSGVAGIYGLIAVVLFMIGYYRIPGLMAVISLLLYGTMVMGILVSMGATLTLPGIAGFILSLGIIVDANIIIFERLKEDLKNKKTLRSAVDGAFSKALSTILDANITTLIAAIILFYFGTGPIRGFAVTLSIGIVVSMFTAIVITKLLLKLFVQSNIVKNPKLYGA